MFSELIKQHYQDISFTYSENINKFFHDINFMSVTNIHDMNSKYLTFFLEEGKNVFIVFSVFTGGFLLAIMFYSFFIHKPYNLNHNLLQVRFS